MTQATQTNQPAPEPVIEQVDHTALTQNRGPSEIAPRRALLFGLLAGPLVYSLHFVALYLLSEFGCESGQLQGVILGVSVLVWWVLGLTLIAALLTASSAWVAYGQWRQLRQPGHLQQTEATPRLFALLGVWFGSLFTLQIVLIGLPALFVDVLCDWI